MSGIAGLYFLNDRSVEEHELHRMLAVLARRGPDGSGKWYRGAAGLGHQMSRITPESPCGRYPLEDPASELVITADVRIDNRAELSTELELRGAKLDDGELILHAYQRWGQCLAEKLAGDFSFAILDLRHKTLFCARDHFGCKPFYYCYTPGHLFAFASEIKALLSLPDAPRKLNEAKVAAFLAPVLQNIDDAGTFYAGIFRLPPAHTLTVTPDGILLRRYWSLDPSRELKLGSDQDYAEAFRALFTEAVRCRLRGTSPIGCMLSGGLDSSSVACVAQGLFEAQRSPGLHTFSAVLSDASECGESPFINEILRARKMKSHVVRSGELFSFVPDLEKALNEEDEPWDTTLTLSHRILFRAAQQQGVGALMTGWDGDLVASHDLEYLAYLLRGGHWWTMAVEAAGIARRHGHSRWRVIAARALRPAAPRLAVDLWTRLARRDRPYWVTNFIVNPDFARRVHLQDMVRSASMDPGRCGRTMREEQARLLGLAYIPLALECEDRLGAAFSIEPRYPFLDKRLVEFSLALPWQQKVHDGWTKLILRRAMQGVVPEPVCWRTDKANLNPDLIHSLLSFEKELLSEVFASDLGDVCEYVDAGFVRAAYRRYQIQGSFEDLLTVWHTAALALWRRRTSL